MFTIPNKAPHLFSWNYSTALIQSLIHSKLRAAKISALKFIIAKLRIFLSIFWILEHALYYNYIIQRFEYILQNQLGYFFFVGKPIENK